MLQLKAHENAGAFQGLSFQLVGDLVKNCQLLDINIEPKSTLIPCKVIANAFSKRQQSSWIGPSFYWFLKNMEANFFFEEYKFVVEFFMNSVQQLNKKTTLETTLGILSC